MKTWNNTVGIITFFSTLIISPIAVGDSVYSEDFSADPNFTISNQVGIADQADTAIWNSDLGIYDVHFYEYGLGAKKYAVTPQFERVSGQSFTVTFDFNYYLSSWGHGAYIQFIDGPVTDYSATDGWGVYGMNITLYDHYAGSIPGAFRLNDLDPETSTFTTPYTNPNYWYSVTMNFDHSTGMMELTLINRDTGGLFYNETLAFNPGEFDRIAFGTNSYYWDGREIGLRFDNINVSTVEVNTAPIADAGIDQVITASNSVVMLDGTNSYDPDGDALSYQWSLTGPDGSSIMMSDSTTSTPSFVIRSYGDYIAELVVIDANDAISTPDTVKISSENLPPVAIAGNNQVMNLWETVRLDGSGSFDPNGDTLNYLWRAIEYPTSAAPYLSLGGTDITTSFSPIVTGTYVFGLIVDDGSLSSEESRVTIEVVFFPSASQEKLIGLIDDLNSLPDMVFSGGSKNGKQGASNANGHRTSFTRQLQTLIRYIADGNTDEAITKLLSESVLGKVNGCEKLGTADANDVIVDCNTQLKVYFDLFEIATVLNPVIKSASNSCTSRVVDYCGPSANPDLAEAIPDELLGPFKTSCEWHDYCYFDAGAAIAEYGIEKYSDGSASDSPTNPWYSLVVKELSFFKPWTYPSQEKARCDLEFFKSMVSACIAEKGVLFQGCTDMAYLYYKAVSLGAFDALKGAIAVQGQCSDQ